MKLQKVLALKTITLKEQECHRWFKKEKQAACLAGQSDSAQAAPLPRGNHGPRHRELGARGAANAPRSSGSTRRARQPLLAATRDLTPEHTCRSSLPRDAGETRYAVLQTNLWLESRVPLTRRTIANTPRWAPNSQRLKTGK